MIHKLHIKHGNVWSGVGKPKVGDLLLMHNPIFGNDEYTMYYKGFPKDTVYIVVLDASDSLRLRPVTTKHMVGSFERFICSRGFGKHFKPYTTTTKGALKGLTID